MGKKSFILLAVLGLFFSCGIEEVGGEQTGEEGAWRGPGSIIVETDEGIGVGTKEWYAVGVDYPDEYDWMVDADKGSIRCSLVVFVNGIPMMKVPVGDKYETSADPDMHRIIGNSLYTDYSTDSETVIKRNGESLFRYPAREMIVDMAVEGNMVYTLGQSRDGEGFSFRVNGQPLMEKSVGYVFPHLHRCEDGYSFAFCETIGSGLNVSERYYHYLAGEVLQVAVREDIKKVWDIVFQDDSVCYLASMVGISPPVLAVGDSFSPLHIPDNLVVRNCCFIPGSRNLDIECVLDGRRKQLFSGLWRGCELVQMFPSGHLVSSVCVCGDSLSCVLNSSARGAGGLIYRCGELLELPAGYISMGGCSIAMADGLLYVGLTSTVDQEPAVWVENEMKPLEINGFISHISAD